MRHKWTNEETKFLIEKYTEEMFAQDIADALGLTIGQVRNKAFLLGLKVSKEKLSRAGRMSSTHPNVIAAQYKKGSVPKNKGKRMNPELYAKCRPTMFQKGNIPSNHKDVGSERITRDGYIEIKVSEPNKWMLKHRWIWEQTNGKIPRGMNLSFINGDKTDIRIDNLQLKTKAENMIDNSLYNYPKELVDVIRLRGVLNRQIHKNGKQ